MTVFLIRPEDVKLLKTAVHNALQGPIPWETLKIGMSIEHQGTDRLTLADKKGLGKIERTIEQVILPLGWRVAISCEDQPAGRVLHLSMSSPEKGKIPNEHAMKMVIEACGYSFDDVARDWLEEFEPGWNAINVLILRKN